MAAQLRVMDLTLSVIKLSQTFFKKALCDNTCPEYTLVCVKLLQYFQVCFPPKKVAGFWLFFVDQGIVALTTHSAAP